MAVMWSVIFYTVLAVAAFYFILLQPVLKQQKARRKAIESLRIGDEVLTTGGLIAEVVDVISLPDRPTELILELAPGVRVRALTDAIERRLSTLEPVEEETEEQAAEPTPNEEAVGQRA